MSEINCYYNRFWVCIGEHYSNVKEYYVGEPTSLSSYKRCVHVVNGGAWDSGFKILNWVIV